MDTRTKITSTPAAGGTVVAGYFDPMTARHVEALAKAGRGLTVLVLDPPEPLLAARARAELVAGLACVNEVAIGCSDDLLARAIRLEDGDLARRDEIVDVIRTKHGR